MSKIIIWGHPLGSHTYSYIHEAFYKAFQFMGYETYWFHDYFYPRNFDWQNCMFLTEGFADKNIPLHKSCSYIVHGPPNPKKYIDINPKRFIDMRYNHVWMKDHIYDYILNKNEIEKVGKCCYFEQKSNKKIAFTNDYHNYEISDYDKFYITWATNKLPHQIDFNDINFPKENAIYFCGNISANGRCENYSAFAPFINECVKNGVQFIHNDPFVNPLKEEEVVLRTKKTLISIDIRGPEHLKNGYVPCRVFKSISSGRLGTTNSLEVYNELEGHCLLDSPDNLFYSAQSKEKDKNFILDAMKYIKDNHTYINRIQSLLKVL